MITTHITEKTCTKCKETKPVNEFYKQERGYSTYCKSCMKELSRQRVLDGRDRESKLKSEKKRGYIREEHPTYIPPKLTDLQQVCRSLYRNAKKRSLFANTDFDLSKEYVEQIVQEFCDNNYHVLTTGKAPFKPSLDRIDNTKGYTRDNITVCWQIENYCKNTYTNEEVIEFCKRKLGLL